MSSETTWPQILEAEWEPDQVETLFDDLQHGAEILHVQVRTTPAVGLQESAISLAEAHNLFQRNEAGAIQIRYQFGGRIWCDTLIVGPAATRIIRTTQL